MSLKARYRVSRGKEKLPGHQLHRAQDLFVTNFPSQVFEKVPPLSFHAPFHFHRPLSELTISRGQLSNNMFDCFLNRS